MCTVFSDLCQEGLPKQRRKRHPPHPRHVLGKPHQSIHRRRSGKGRWRWCWRGGPRRSRDRLDMLSSSGDSDLEVPLPVFPPAEPMSLSSCLDEATEAGDMKDDTCLASMDSQRLPPDVCLPFPDLPSPITKQSSLGSREALSESSKGSPYKDEKRDEFWAALENNYQYLMDSNLIDTWKDAGSDLLGSPLHEWSFEEFTDQFKMLTSWLDLIQKDVDQADTASTYHRLQLSNHSEEMAKRSYKRKMFNNQSGRLMVRSPELKSEVSCRVSYLNSMWERLEQSISIYRMANIPTDIEYDLKGLRKWINKTEKKLQPIDFKEKWSPEALLEKTKEIEEVKKEIWCRSKVVGWVVRLCEGLGRERGESLNSWVRGRRIEPTRAASYVRVLERRWQLLYLQALEWQCHVDSLIEKNKSSPIQKSGDEEPLSKQPRLTRVLHCPNEDAEVLKTVTDSTDFDMDIDRTVEVREELAVVHTKRQQDTSELPEAKRQGRSHNSSTSDTGSSSGAATKRQEPDTSITESPAKRREPVTVHISAGKRQEPDSLFTCSSPKRQETDCLSSKRQEVDSSINPSSAKRQEFDTEQDAPAKRPATSVVIEKLSPQVTHRFMFDEKSMFTSSGRSGLCGVFYWKHSDTEKETKSDNVEEAESSEDDVTFPVTQEGFLEGEDSVEELVEKELVAEACERPPPDVIAKLVQDAENILVSPARSKPSRQHVQRSDPDSKVVGDSCDASGECTSDEDSSCGDGDTTLTGTLETASPEEVRVILRPRIGRAQGPRPWSVSGALHIPDRLNLPHSISESAIHQLSSSPANGKMACSVNNVSTLSSSTVEDMTQAQDGSGGGYSSNSLRRRKLKLKKRSLMRKSISGGSESQLGNSDITLGSPSKLTTLSKLACRRASADKLDSPLRRFPHTAPSHSSSGSDSESDPSVRQQKAQSVQPNFLLGPHYAVRSYASERKDKIVSADSSFSEQAWDNYQEKYMSEAYSEEAPDPESTRRILDFGDDYRNFLDSQSDCASSLGPPTPLTHRCRRTNKNTGESDSEFEDVFNLVKQSSSMLHYSEKVFSKQLSRSSPQLVLASDFAELVTTCKDNIKCLSQLLEKIEEGTALLSVEQCNIIRDLIKGWEKLERNTEELQRERTLKREMASLRDELLEIATRSSTVLEPDLEHRDQLELRIQEVKGELSRLRELKKLQLHEVNIAVHRFLTDCPSSSPGLKDQVTDLYRLWDDTYQRSSGRLHGLEEAASTWQQFENHLVGLQVALRGDQEALSLLHAALLEGRAASPDVASSLRDIAKLLSEKNTTIHQENGVVVGTRTDELVGCNTEGSLSDSGISDSGSEQDLSERERRLSALRRLVRHLEAVLAPNSQAILNMSKRLEATESELRGLQQTCRDLIVKTAVVVESKGKLPVIPPSSPVRLSSNTEKKERDSDGEKGSRWLVRVIRAALPFHVALIALFCIACLLEPHCCDSFNNLHLSFTPQLRYVKGPPPI